jgi:hypothetical protein
MEANRKMRGLLKWCPFVGNMVVEFGKVSLGTRICEQDILGI